MATKAKLYLLTSVVLAVLAAMLAGCGDIGDTTGTNPSGPTVERGVNLGELELYYDFSSGEGTTTFTPNTEVTGETANVNAIGVTGIYGKTIYDKRTNIPSLGGAGFGPAAVLGLAVYSTGKYIINGPVLQVQTNQVLNQLYATYGGAKIGQNVTPLDVDDGVANAAVAGAGGHAFLLENDFGSPVANPFGWVQTFEQQAADLSDGSWTTVDVADAVARYHFYQVSSGWTSRTWAPAYEAAGNSAALVGRATAADATPPNAVGLAMAFQLPLTTSNQVPDGIYIKGNLLADAIVDSHTLGPDAGWVPLGGGIDLGQSFDFYTPRGLVGGDAVTEIDRDSTGRIYGAYLGGPDVDVARLQPGLTAVANDDEIIPSITTGALWGLDVVDEFSKIYIATGAAPTGLVNIFSIPADGADGTAIGTLDVALEQTFAAGDHVTDIVVDPTRRMLYVAYGGAGAGDGTVIGFALNADGTLTDNTHDTTSAAAIFDAATGGGKLAINSSTGSVYVSSGGAGAVNGVSRLVATTLGADGVYDINAGVVQTYTNVAVSSTGVVYAAVESAVAANGILPYDTTTSPDTAGNNDAGLFSATAVPAGDQGVVRFESNGTYATGTWLFGDEVDAATVPNLLFAGVDRTAATNAPTDFVLWGSGTVTGTSKMLFLDDFGGAATNIAWVSM